MRSSSLYSFLGIALCVGFSLAGCGGDDDDDSTPAPKVSGEGESCTSAADCASTLVCVNLKCAKKGGGNDGGADGSGGSTGGSSARGGTSGTGGKAGTAGTAAAPVLGSEGESCTKRADCEADLHCYNQRCTADGTGAAGGGGMGGNEPPAVVLGQVGETCVLPSDCAQGLTCLPGSASAQDGVGVCGTANTGITPTGKSCVGECKSSADCCQLPLGLQGAFAVKSCADLDAALDGVDCDDPGTNAAACFVRATYCECDDAWDCTDSRCVYKKACSADGLATEGCPTLSRTDRPLPTTCIDEECATPAPTGCEADTDCEMTAVTDDPADTCSADECTCYEATGLCYRKCNKDLDCAIGYTCDTKTHVCETSSLCTDNQFCQQRLGDINAVCDAGACRIGCNTDLDCNGSFVSGQFMTICNQEKHVCEDFGCRADSDCWQGLVQMFCIETPEAAAGTTIQSAVTD